MTKKKQLFVRPLNDRMVAGVCAAVAKRFNVDVTLVRILWAFLLIPGGLPGLIPYVICWIIIPSE